MPASANPFDPTQPNLPFVGREVLFARVHQHLTGAPVTQAVLLLGRRRSGRTAFLRALRQRFDESFVWADCGLTPQTTRDETAFWHMAWEAAKHAAAARGLSVHRLPHFPDDKPAADLRVWFAQRGLPELYQLIRPHRRLVWVMDNAEPLADAVQRGDLPTDLGAAVGMLLGTQLGLVLTAHLDAEARMANLAPLTQAESTLRLSAFSSAEVEQLLTHGRGGSESGYALALHRMTGGAPELTLRAAALAHDYARGNYYKTEHLRAITPDLLLWARPGFGLLWDNLTADEQVVMVALAHLHYAQPDKPIAAEQVEAWLTDSEYPLDLTAIFSVLRRLEFFELVDHAHRDVRIRAEVFEQWVRETVRRDHLRRAAPTPPPDSLPSPRTTRLWLIVLGVVVGLLLLLIALGAPSPVTPDPLPTVVLGG